ncbi:MAG: hypothetical protein ABID54_09375 [Pseudomonadota bacterium]
MPLETGSATTAKAKVLEMEKVEEAFGRVAEILSSFLSFTGSIFMIP